MKTLIILYRIVIVCLVFHGVRFLWGSGVAGFSFTHRLSIMSFWFLLAWMFWKWPEKSSIPIGLFMLISVAFQSYILWSVQQRLSGGELPSGQGWFSFAFSVLPIFIGGLSALSFRVIESRHKKTVEQGLPGHPLGVPESKISNENFNL